MTVSLISIVVYVWGMVLILAISIIAAGDITWEVDYTYKYIPFYDSQELKWT